MIIWLEGNVPSLKNSKIKTAKGIFPSKTVKNYLKKLGIIKYSVRNKVVVNYNKKICTNKFEELRESFNEMKANKPYPLVIGFHFVRSSKHKFDFHNAVQIIADLLVAHDFIEDDNMDCLIPYPLEINGKYYTYDPNKPGVYITIFNNLKLCKC